ncbi:MAG: PH domain-containing protein [Planctomycetia bacterium]|nr:PH domain-containing protein [Planctomycetia bacterium]
MKQAIAGVSPSEVREVNVMEVWPSIAMFSLGRLLGRLFAIQAGIYIFRVGNLFALAGIPFALALYFLRLAPSFFGAPLHGGFYRLTNRRVIVLRNEIKFTGPSGQQWYDAGDLVFRRAGVETFRLVAVSRPDSFRHTCLKSHASYVGVKRALARQPVHA